MNLWNFNDPRERMWAARTRQLQAAHVTVFDRLWSILPFLRPLVTITGDSLQDYGKDGEGGRLHDLLGTRCDPYVNRLLTGKDFDYHCHSNLTRAVLPYGLTEFDVHDVLNVFQCTGQSGITAVSVLSLQSMHAPCMTRPRHDFDRLYALHYCKMCCPVVPELQRALVKCQAWHDVHGMSSVIMMQVSMNRTSTS